MPLEIAASRAKKLCHSFFHKVFDIQQLDVIMVMYKWNFMVFFAD